MKNLKSFNELNEEAADMGAELKKLYNGIMNDTSIQRYSVGWSDVTKGITKRFKGKEIERTDERFSDGLLTAAIMSLPEGDALRKTMEAFARELDINLETLGAKYKNKR